MRKWLRNAFTLVELVIVIAIVGILAAIAIPRFIDIRREAYTAQRDGIIGSTRAGILTVAAQNQVSGNDAKTFPPNLEATWAGMTGGAQWTTGANDCSGGDKAPCFELVIPGGFSDANWDQTGAGTYTFDNPNATGAPDDVTCTYDTTQVKGTFLCS